MKFRTQNSDIPVVAQEFSYKTDIFKLDEITGKLVKVDEQDDFALIQSSADCALSEVLKRYGYDENNQPDLPQKWHEQVDDSASFEEVPIVDYFPSQAKNVNANVVDYNELFKQFLAYQASQSDRSEIKTEVVKNEETSQQKDESEDISKHGSQGSQKESN